MLPIDHYIHLGNDYERHWWRQTNEKITLNVRILQLLNKIIFIVYYDFTLNNYFKIIKNQHMYLFKNIIDIPYTYNVLNGYIKVV